MNILEKIVNEIQIDLIDKKKLLPIESLEKNIDYDSNFPCFYDSLNNEFVSLIAEIKDTSPSKGKLMRGKNFNDLAKNYLNANVNAVSVVTEKNFFKGFYEAIKFPIGIKKIKLFLALCLPKSVFLNLKKF